MKKGHKRNQMDAIRGQQTNSYRKIIKLYSRYKLSLLLLFIGIPVISQLNIWSQTMLGTIVDNIAEAELWMPVAVGYAAVMAVLFLAKQGYSMIEQWLSFKVTYSLRAAMADRILHMKSEALHSYSTDDVMQMWNSDTRELQTVSVKDIFNYMILTLSAVLAIVELRDISVYFPIIALAVNVLSLLPVRLIGRKHRQRSRKLRETQVAMNEKFYTVLNAIRLVKAYGKEKEETEAFEKANESFVDAKMGFFLSSRVYKSIVTSLNSIAPTIILLVANFQVREGRMTIGDIVLATSLLATVSLPFSEGGTFFISLKAVGFKFDRLFELLEAEEEQTKGVSVEGKGPYSLSLENVAYGNAGFHILEDINLTVHAGEKVAVVGESGSGKTTLNNLILRLYPTLEGTVRLGDSDITEFDLREYRKGIHYSQSNTYITNDTVMANLVLSGASEEKCVGAAKAIRFHDEIMAMPEGYQTMIDASASNISGGQKKKIAIIRALTQESRLYILDEITRGIDESSAEFIMDYLLDNLDATVIFTMHNFQAIERMDKIVVMRTGHIIAEGKHEELYQSCEYYRRLYDSRKREGDE